MKTDSELKADVARELACDLRIDATTIGVAAHHGVVTLTGTVSSWADKHAAEEAAFRIAGVRDLANDIEIKPSWSTTQNDTEIAEAVRNALEWDRFVPHDKIRLTVANHGTVTLTGTVHTLGERDDAETAVRNLAGVRCVVNQLAVEVPPVTENALHATITHALARHAEREAARVEVGVHGDVVVLTGHVGSWTERRAVVGAARGTPGVRHVEDRLHIG
jgi:osmotically-inducible protein OsmY